MAAARHPSASKTTDDPSCWDQAYFCCTMPFSRCFRPQFNLIIDPNADHVWNNKIILGQIPIHATCGGCCEPGDIDQILAAFDEQGIKLGAVVRGTNDFEHEAGCCYVPARDDHLHEAVKSSDELVAAAPRAAGKDVVGAVASAEAIAVGVEDSASLALPFFARYDHLAASGAKAESAMIQMLQFALPDAGDGEELVSRSTELAAVIEGMHRAIAAGDGFYVHCKAGVGRSWMILMCYSISRIE